MKKLIVLAVLGAATYFGYQQFEKSAGAAPETIEDPVYAELRIDMQAPGRLLNLVLLGKMAGEEDCQLRAEKVWDNMITDCPSCDLKVSQCRADLEPRYLRLFDDAQIHSTYLSFTRGSKYERDGRMVIYGMTNEEGDQVCEIVKKEFQKRYSGSIECVTGRRD